MNVLVLGKGGREHALIRAICSSPRVKQVFALPGREGFEPLAVCLPPQDLEPTTLKTFVKDKNIQLVVIGPEQELVEAWSDFFRSLGVLVFGPSQQAAQLESSKLFAKSFMSAHNIPTSEFVEVDSVHSALEAQARFTFPLVLKADGLAGGKGVFIVHNKEELKDCSTLLFEKQTFGSAGKKALIETFQKGQELSVFVLTNGEQYTILPLARDYKKLKAKDHGPNTGGMGAFAPYKVPESLWKAIETDVVRPTVEGIKKQKLFYRGVLYIGLMIVKGRPFVLEYNVRFGDPEAQVLLPLLEGDWLSVLGSIAEGKIPTLKWRKELFCACVVLASEGYPLKPVTGELIKGNVKQEIPNTSYFLHAGTKKTEKGWVTAGGRVLNAVGLGPSLSEALQNAYTQANEVKWHALQKREDIGKI